MTSVTREAAIVEDEQVTAAASAVAKGALGQVKPAGLAHKVRAECISRVVIVVNTRPTFLTPGDAQGAASALLP